MTAIPKEFSEFVIKAKANTYAEDKERSTPSRPNSKDIHFEEGDFGYIDTYLGSFNFIGQEIVWHKGISIWGMNYFGKMLVDEIPNGFIGCLKSALKSVPLEAPFRGPSIFKYEQFEYSCSWNGELCDFYGSEKVFFKNKEIFSLRFDGGELK